MPARWIMASTRTAPKNLQARLKPLIRKTQPYAKRIAHRGIWVEPALLAEIEYRSRPRARCGIRCSRASERTYDLALDWPWLDWSTN